MELQISNGNSNIQKITG